MITPHIFFIALTVILYLLGRVCDDLAWYSWESVSTDAFKQIAFGSFIAAALITIGRRIYQQGDIKDLFLQSQKRFIIPWALVILLLYLLTKMAGCDATHNPQDTQFVNILDFTGCIIYGGVIIFTNLNYSLICNIKGDMPLVIIFQCILFGQIIFNGHILLNLLYQLKGEPKDYAVLFISLFISWEVLVMDLIFRGAYEEREKIEKHKELQRLVFQHKQICKSGTKQSVQEMKIQNMDEVQVPGTQRQIRIEQGQTNPIS